MLYDFLKFLLRLTVRVYFKRITIRNAELIPEGVPIIFAPNHPSAFMDPIIVATSIKTQVHFLAAGEAFANPIVAWLFKQLYMIPVYRPAIQPELAHKNLEVFDKCYHHLEKRGAMLIFPEGNSKTEPRLRKIKTGVARIALSVEARNNYKLGVLVVPVGLNYTNPHKFHSEVFVNIGKPIKVSEYFEQYIEDEYAGVSALTAHLQQRLERNSIFIKDAKFDRLIRHISIIYKSQLKDEMGITVEERDKDFLVTKEIIEAVNHYQDIDPHRIEVLKAKMEVYFRKVRYLKLSDRMLKPATTSHGNTAKWNQKQESSLLNTLLFFILGFPLHAFGWINNIVPFKLTGLVTNISRVRVDFYGSVLLISGLFIYLFFYGLLITAVILLLGNWWLSLFYAALLPLSGLFTLSYVGRYRKAKGTWLLLSIFYKQSAHIATLIKEREEILEGLNEAKEEYLKAKAIGMKMN